jgi:hypothetical protein
MPAERRTPWSRRTLALLVCIAAWHRAAIAAEPPAAPPGPSSNATFSFESGTYDASVPTPESVLGFPIGRRPVRYDEMRRYFEAVDAASPRVAVRPYARSHEGRDLVYAVIGTESRIADLEAVRAAADQWADPRRGSDQLPAELPVVAWLGCDPRRRVVEHRRGVASTSSPAGLDDEASAPTCLSASTRPKPDGRERYLADAVGRRRGPEPDAQSLQHQVLAGGRANHHLFTSTATGFRGI